MSLHYRKRMRLKNYDYSTPGCYFVTILTHNRQKLFWDYDELNDIGRMVEKDICSLSAHFNDVKVDNYIVMPDHVHLLVTIGCDALGNNDKMILAEVLGENIHSKLNVIIGSLKSGITRKFHEINPSVKVWHKSYFDHIVVNKKEFDEIWDYIDANPIRWKIKHGLIIDE